MSSKVPHGLREKRGVPKFDDLPPKIQSVLKSIHSTCGPVGLYGSYSTGTRAEDSDLDIGVKDFRTYSKIIKQIGEHHNIRIDCNELGPHHLLIIS